jgi:hypothetical protein
MSARRTDRQRAEVRRCRQRQRDGIIRITIFARETDLVAVLVSAELLQPGADHDRSAIQDAVQRAVDLWTEPS